MKNEECNMIINGGCLFVSPAPIEKYFVKKEDKYEAIYKYYMINDSIELIFKLDTSNVSLDSVQLFSRNYILISKNGKHGLYAILSPHRIMVDQLDLLNLDEYLKKEFVKRIDLKYDEVIFDRNQDSEVSYAKVRVGDDWGIIDSKGKIILDIKYAYVRIAPAWQMALVEYEPNRMGYKHFNGVEYFQRTNQLGPQKK